MYYRSGDEVFQMYPADNWHSSLFEHSYSNFDLPGDGYSYKITEDIFSGIYCFLSFDDLDEVDFEPLVASSLTIGELVNPEKYKPARLVIWDQQNAQFKGKMGEGEVLPLLIDLSFGH